MILRILPEDPRFYDDFNRFPLDQPLVKAKADLKSSPSLPIKSSLKLDDQIDVLPVLKAEISSIFVILI